MKFLGISKKNDFEVNGKTVLLTGGSDGMGKSVARILAQKGANIVIVARNVEKLKAALEEIKTFAAKPESQKFHFISADVSKAGEAVRVVSEVSTWNGGLPPDIVWCVAGASHPALFLEASPEILRKQMDLNYWSCADMAHAILSQWLSPNSSTAGKPRHLIFTSSSVAFFSIAGYGPYSPAKAALRSLSDTLTQEVKLYTSSVKIHTVFPGSILSAGYENENKMKPEITKILESDDPKQTPDVVAERSIKGLENGEYLITTNWLASAMRACTWGGSRRNNWLVDSMFMGVTNIAWPFVQRDLDGKVLKYGRKHGHPSTYSKTTHCEDTVTQK